MRHLFAIASIFSLAALAQDIMGARFGEMQMPLPNAVAPAKFPSLMPTEVAARYDELRAEHQKQRAEIGDTTPSHIFRGPLATKTEEFLTSLLYPNNKSKYAYGTYWSIEEQMYEDRQSARGFVIFRCTYESDDEWNLMMDKLRAHGEVESRYATSGLFQLLQYTVIEDKDKLDNASPEQVEQQFAKWLDTKPWNSEQPLAFLQEKSPLSPRYGLALMIDQTALNSILYKPKMKFQMRYEEHPDCGYAILVGIRDPLRTNHSQWDDAYWKKVNFANLPARVYEMHSKFWTWEADYVRPPRVDFC